MARINIVNADNKIDATPQRAYFKLKQTGGPKGEKGDTGAQGPQGATGPQGASASVVVNSTTTLPAGSDATVENIGTPQNVKLNFGIPTGPQGPQGEQGPQGAQGPQGLKGDTGAKGADGAAAKVTVGNTNTGAAGTNAIVENTGSETYAVLNFTIPRGDKGETGPMPDIAQTTGQATDEVMSQKATTDALATKQNTLTAGTGITITSDTVSADTTVLATKADLNDYAPQATTYTKTEADELLAPKLEADVVASLPATGEEGKLYLTPKAYTRQTATGNPIEATISDGAGTLETFQLDGDAFQQTYTGKNLIGFDTYSNEISGITCNTSPDGTITLNGTRTGSTSGAIIFETNSPKFKLSGTFTMTIIIVSGSFSGANIGYNATNSSGAQQFYQGYASNGIYNQGTLTPEQGRLDATTGVNVLIGSGASTFDNLKFKIQVVAGEKHDSDYEPYVGGIPAPNPSYPQDVQTVTGEQVVTVNGTSYPIKLASKNLFDKNSLAYIFRGYLGTNSCRYNGTSWAAVIPVEAGKTYTFSRPNATSQASDSSYAFLNSRPAEGVTYNGERTAVGADLTFTATAPTGAKYLIYYFSWNASDSTADTVMSGYQLEEGSMATSYEQFWKIELCKLGDYQDYIYKDGDSWKVHKATNKLVLNGSEEWRYYNGVCQLYSITDYATSGNTPYCGAVSGNSNVAGLGSVPENCCCFINVAGGTTPRFYVRYESKFGSADTISQYLTTNPTSLYYALATATDTTITDTTLIAQLEAIRTAALENGANTITNSAAGSNLAGDMEITYYGYNPTNRYDKFIWLDLNNNYEQIGE